MTGKLSNIPTNLIMGFLGVGKTTAILNLLQQKPADENWAVLVNEFGKVGIDGAIFAEAGATVKEIAGGCLCCAVNVPFQIGINRLLKETKPDRLLIEPTGLGHPKKVLELLSGSAFNQVLDLRASICLVDPEKLKDDRYTSNENFIDQIALADVLVANKMDLADAEASTLFYQYAEKIQPEKMLIAQTTQGQLDVAWLDMQRSSLRHAIFPQAHKITKIKSLNNIDQDLTHQAGDFQSVGYIFPKENCFDYPQLNKLLTELNTERIKALVQTNQGWFIINGVAGNMTYTLCKPAMNSRIEIIARQDLVDISTAIQQCLIHP